MTKDKARIDRAVALALRWGMMDGSHHKQWVIDQMLRALLADEYAEAVRSAMECDMNQDDLAQGFEPEEWDRGIAP